MPEFWEKDSVVTAEKWWEKDRVPDDSFEGQLIGGEQVPPEEMAQVERGAELLGQQRQARQTGEYWEGVDKRIGNLIGVVVEPLSRGVAGTVGRAADVPIALAGGTPVVEKALETPGINLPRAGQAETTGGQVSAGTYNAFADLLAMFSTPNMVAALPAAQNKAVLSVWLGQMAGHQPERAAKAVALFKEGKTQEAVQEVATGVGELAMVELGRRHVTKQPRTEAEMDAQSREQAAVEQEAIRGGTPFVNTDRPLEPLVGERVREAMRPDPTLTPLETAADVAQVSSAPATAAALREQVAFSPSARVLPEPVPPETAAVTAAEVLQRGTPTFKSVITGGGR